MCRGGAGLWVTIFTLSAAAQTASDRSSTFTRRFEEIKKSATQEELYRFLWALPKGGDLHNHHEYSVPMEDWFTLAVARNTYFTRLRLSDCGSADSERLLYLTLRRSSYLRLPDCVRKDFAPLAALSPMERQGWISSLQLDLPGEGREEFFEKIVPRLSELEEDPAIIPELLVRQLRQSAAEGVRYVETQTDPLSFHNPDESEMPWKAGAELYRKRLAQPDALATGVSARLQVAVLRFSEHAEDNLRRAFEFIDHNRDLWVGVNLVGREDNEKGKPLRFLETLRELRRDHPDVRLSLHAGESEFPGHQVRDTLQLGADRIGHGTNLISDPETLLLLRNNRFLVEVSLVSNELLGYTPDLRKHPFAEYLRLGIPVCLNTDDRGAMDSNIIDEYFLATRNFNLSWGEVVRIGRWSLEYSFAELPLKRRLLREYDRAIADFETKYDRADWRTLLKTVRARHSGYGRRALGLF